MTQVKIKHRFATRHPGTCNRVVVKNIGLSERLGIKRQLRMHLLKRATIWLAIVFAISFQSLADAQTQHSDDREIMAAYNASIYDSSVYKFSNLRPLYPLKFDPVTNRAHVVTLTDWKGYKKGRMDLEREVWVTAVPEVKNLCQNFTGDIPLRLKQLLGLHPATKIVHFVEISVGRGDVFRPTTDPETTSVLPCGCPVTPNCGLEFPAVIEGGKERHVSWIAKQTFRSYVISESTLTPVGYPWTRLGYTYDWRPGSTKYGASEYVIRKGANVTILEEPFPIEQYCKSKE